MALPDRQPEGLDDAWHCDAVQMQPETMPLDGEPLEDEIHRPTRGEGEPGELDGTEALEPGESHEVRLKEERFEPGI